jgi:hypothetical protein
MRSLFTRPFRWGLFIGILGVASILSCSTLPPPQPAKDIKSIVGKWEGYAESPRVSRFDMKLTVKQDGTWQMITDPAYLQYGREFSGKVSVWDEKFLFNTNTPDLSGTATLHFLEGKRYLVYTNEDGSIKAQLRSVF